MAELHGGLTMIALVWHLSFFLAKPVRSVVVRLFLQLAASVGGRRLPCLSSPRVLFCSWAISGGFVGRYFHVGIIGVAKSFARVFLVLPCSVSVFSPLSLIIKNIFSLPCPIFGLKNPNSRLAVADALTFQGSEIYHVFFSSRNIYAVGVHKKSYLFLFSENEKLLIIFYWTATSATANNTAC
jgi:hypothetical protein